MQDDPKQTQAADEQDQVEENLPDPEVPAVETQNSESTAATHDNKEEAVQEKSESTEDSETNLPDESTDAASNEAENTGSTSQDDLYSSTLDFIDQGDAHWYVVHTYSGHEKKVSQALQQRVASMRLQDKILEVLVPTQEKIEVRKGKKEQVKEKIFPGYILVRMIVDDYSWLAVRTTPGVTGFVGAGNKPTAIPDEEVKAIQKFMSMEAPKYKTVFSVGEAVKIIEGPFAEFLGTVDNIDEAKGKIKVLVSIFGRETPVELDFMQVSKL